MKQATHILFHKVSEGEVFPGKQEGPLEKLLVVFAFLPQRRLKQVWVR